MATQDTRQIAVSTPLGKDALLFLAMNGTEELGRLFEFQVDLLSTDEKVNLTDLLGKSVTVRLDTGEDKQRFFNGIVSRFTQFRHYGRYAWYQATLRPWLWFLTRKADCRIFQGMTVPDIVKQIFREQDLTDFEDATSGSYRTWEYCVQYRETDFNFVSRLMEHEGIYYFFRHEETKHTLVMADAYSSHEKIPDPSKIPYHPPSEGEASGQDTIEDWLISQQVQSGVYSLTDYDFEKPQADLGVKSSIQRSHEKAGLEVYDYPGDYIETSDGDLYAKRRIEEFQAQYEQARGRGDVREFVPGGLFEMTDHPRDDQNREYLIVQTTYTLRSNEYESDRKGAPQTTYSCEFVVIDSKQPFRSSRFTPKPMIRGPQTAEVVGQAGEEIWTDKYGRVKVQFHWDREGKKDENSSCWVRVAQLWAGQTWGGIQVPRIGQEVIVEFLEGDPDRPIITGRVYNADQMPPYELPANATQSGVKSRSSKGGGGANFNEFRFEDKIGSEEIYLHAEKDYNQITENDRTEDVGRDRSLHVVRDKSEKIDNNKTIQVLNNHSETIGSSMSISVGAALTETVVAAYAESVGAAMALTVGAALTETVGAAKIQTIGANKSETIGVNKTVSVGGDETVNIDGTQNHTIGQDQKAKITGARTVSITGGDGLQVGEAQTISVKGNQQVDVGAEFILEAKDSVTIKTGKSSITMDSGGTISIKGVDISVEGDGKINVKATSDLTMKGSKSAQN